MKYTITEFADLAGVTTRTLRYYDEIGLLIPAEKGDNGYRYYDQHNLMKLQQILFFRELDVPRDDIQLIMSSPDFNLLRALEEHRISLQEKVIRLNKLIDTIDHTLATIKREQTMTAKEYFEGFDEKKYEADAKQRWGESTKYIESQKKWAGYSKEQKEAIKAEDGQLTVRMVGKDSNTPPDNPDVQAAIGEYLAYLNKYFYTCDAAFLRGFADMWVEDPRFAINYERVRAGGAEFVREAVHIFCDRNA